MARHSRDESMFAHVATAISNVKKALGKPWVEDLINYETCPECKEYPASIMEGYSSGDMVCDSCGFCLPGRIICQETEWRHFSGENDAEHDDPSRIGAAANPLLHGSQLQTSIGSSPAAASAYNNNNNSTTKHGTARTLQHAQEATMVADSSDRSNQKLQTRYSEISALCEGMALTRDVVNTAQYYYKLVEDAKTCHVPRTFQEVFSRATVPKADIGKIFKLLQKFLTQPARKKIEDVVEAGGSIPTPSSTAPSTTKTQPSSLNLLPRFRSRLQLPYKCESLAAAICTASVDVIPTLGSRHPASIAGVAIYMASLLLQEKRAFKDVSKAAGIGTQTIRRLYKVFWRV